MGPTSKGGERKGKGGDPLLSLYTPSHYILDKGLYYASGGMLNLN